MEETPLARGKQPLLEDLVPGEWRFANEGRCFVVEQVYPLEHKHGVAQLGEMLRLPQESWQPLLTDGVDADLDMQGLALIDTETTGLARGVGTCAFLVGVGSFIEHGFRVRQYFMPDYADEEALLELLAADLEALRGLVSFNGRCFDWPLLEARYILARRQPPCRGYPHLDLLPLSRRLWRRMLCSCALGHLEQQVLGLERQTSDVPSYLIPQLYEDYVRWGITRPLAGVFYHNAMDILSMVSLLTAIGQLLTSLCQEPSYPCDYLGLASLYEHIGQPEKALTAYRQAATCAADAQTVALAYQKLSFALKRIGRYDEARDVWLGQRGQSLYSYVELAKYYEHRARDYASAREVVCEAIAWMESGRGGGLAIEREASLADLRRRLARIEGRLANAQREPDDR